MSTTLTRLYEGRPEQHSHWNTVPRAGKFAWPPLSNLPRRISKHGHATHLKRVDHRQITSCTWEGLYDLWPSGYYTESHGIALIHSPAPPAPQIPILYATQACVFYQLDHQEKRVFWSSDVGSKSSGRGRISEQTQSSMCEYAAARLSMWNS